MSQQFEARWGVHWLPPLDLGDVLAFPNAGALMSRNVDEDHQGQIMGLNNAAGALARFVGPLCAGFVFAGISVDGPFYLGALIVAPAIALALSAGRAAQRSHVGALAVAGE